MHQQSQRQLQETRTALDEATVLDQAIAHFGHRSGVYTAFLERRGPRHALFRGQGGEELVIGVEPIPGGTRVTGSTYLFDQQVARFLATLPPYVEPPAPPPAALAEPSAEGAA